MAHWYRLTWVVPEKKPLNVCVCVTDLAINFLIRLLTNPPHLKYVATLPCNLSLMACFLTLTFHKAVWQHMQSVVELMITNLMQNLAVKTF